MNPNTENYIKTLMRSDLMADVEKEVNHFYGRMDARERIAEHLQNICPAVLCMKVSTESCVENERRCGIDFEEVADYLLVMNESDD